MNDFENRLKQLLNEQVDHELASRRQQPPAHEQPRHRRGSRPRPSWLLPLLAAAAVIAAVVGGGVVAHSVAGPETSVAPATDISSPTDPVSTPVSIAPTPTGTPSRRTSATPPPSTKPPSSTTSRPTTSRPTTSRPATSGTSARRYEPPPAPGATVALEGATIALPDGWVAHPFNGGSGVSAWCLRVKGGSNDACTAQLFHYTSPSDPPDPDREGFVGNPPQYVCGQAALTATKKASTSTFGGRTADVREFDRSCAATGKKFRTLQYLVVRAPTWGLIVTGATTRDREVAQRIVTDSLLPR